MTHAPSVRRVRKPHAGLRWHRIEIRTKVPGLSFPQVQVIEGSDVLVAAALRALADELEDK